jgi:nucleoside-diphosphate-sugar epimerase
MNILITGSNSPLGLFFIKRLLSTFKDCNILALSRKNINIEDQRLKVLFFDLKKDSFQIDTEFNIVLHIAGLAPKTMKDESDLILVNELGSSHLFHKIKLACDSHILNISSSSVYHDPNEDLLFENSGKTSNDPYGLSKLNFEQFLSKNYLDKNVNILSVRLPVLLVKGVKNNFMSQWLSQIKNGNPITLFNPNALFNACIHSEDIFQFFLTFMKNPKPKHLICNLSSKNPIRVIDAAKLMMINLNSSVTIVEKFSNKKAQLISYELALNNGFKPSSVKDTINAFAFE